MSTSLSTKAALGNSAAIPFFSDLPEKAIRAVCCLWDAVHAPNYNGVTAYSDFCVDLSLVGIDPPARGTVKRWVSGVQTGSIKRPEPLFADTFVEDKDDDAAADDGSIEAFEDYDQSPTDADDTAPVAITPTGLEEYAMALFQKTRDTLVADADARAAGLVARRLRDAADRLESGAL